MYLHKYIDICIQRNCLHIWNRITLFLPDITHTSLCLLETLSKKTQFEKKIVPFKTRE